MSQAAIESLARKWNCSTQDVLDRAVERLRASGLLPEDDYAIERYAGQPYQRKLTIAASAEGEYFIRVPDGWLSLDTGEIVQGRTYDG